MVVENHCSWDRSVYRKSVWTVSRKEPKGAICGNLAFSGEGQTCGLHRLDYGIVERWRRANIFGTQPKYCLTLWVWAGTGDSMSNYAEYCWGPACIGLKFQREKLSSLKLIKLFFPFLLLGIWVVWASLSLQGQVSRTVLAIGAPSMYFNIQYKKLNG